MYSLWFLPVCFCLILLKLMRAMFFNEIDRFSCLDASYTGYDAAVYAAATSYLQSKHTGTTKDWMKKTPSNGTGSSGGGGGSFPARKSWNPATAGPMHYCDVCKVSCAGPQV